MFSSDTIYAFVVVAIPIAVVLFWPWRNRSVLLGVFVVVMIVWPVQLAIHTHDQAEYDRQLELRQQRGESITPDEWLQDGTGDAAGLLVLGWIPPLFFAGVGWGLRSFIRVLRE